MINITKSANKKILGEGKSQSLYIDFCGLKCYCYAYTV